MPICLSYQAIAGFTSRPTPPVMKAEDLEKPAIPVAYGLLILEVAAEHGVSREAMLAGSDFPPSVLNNADARLSLLQAGRLLFKGMQLSGTAAFGYEIGLRSNLTSHGFVGYGLMSNPTGRDAIAFGMKFLQLRLPNLTLRLATEGGLAVVEVAETTALGPLRQCMFDLFMIGIARIAQQMTGGQLSAKREIELWFDYPEPPYYTSYRDRLPRMRFAMGANQLRFPAAYLDLPLQAADTTTAKLVTHQLEREMTLLGFSGDFVAQVRALLVNECSGYPDLETVSGRLNLSSRTLKRRLQEHGTSFQILLDETLRRDSIRLLQDPTLSVEDVATRIGYTDPANFTRAFRKWTGVSPSAYRSRGNSGVLHAHPDRG